MLSFAEISSFNVSLIGAREARELQAARNSAALSNSLGNGGTISVLTLDVYVAIIADLAALYPRRVVTHRMDYGLYNCGRDPAVVPLLTRRRFMEAIPRPAVALRSRIANWLTDTRFWVG
jgi:hypothetical protein